MPCVCGGVCVCGVCVPCGFWVVCARRDLCVGGGGVHTMFVCFVWGCERRVRVWCGGCVCACERLCGVWEAVCVCGEGCVVCCMWV